VAVSGTDTPRAMGIRKYAQNISMSTGMARSVASSPRSRRASRSPGVVSSLSSNSAPPTPAAVAITQAHSAIHNVSAAPASGPFGYGPTSR